MINNSLDNKVYLYNQNSPVRCQACRSSGKTAALYDCVAIETVAADQEDVVYR